MPSPSVPIKPSIHSLHSLSHGLRTGRHSLLTFLLPLLLAGASACEGAASAAGPSDEAPPPGAGTDLVVEEARARSVVLTFTEVDDGLGSPARYDVRYSDSSIVGGWADALPVSEGSCAPPLTGTQIGAPLSCTVRGLEPATSYHFQVAAFRVSGNGSGIYGGLSNIASRTTREDGEGELVVGPESYEFTALNQEFALALEAFDDEGEPVAAPEVVWSSSDESVATVDEEGKVTAKGVGIAIIGVAAVCCAASQAEIEVRQVVTGVSIHPATTGIEVDETVELSAETVDAGGSEAEAELAWTSSDTTVATVSASGVVRGRGAGEVTIFATAGDAVGSALLEVSGRPAPPPPSSSNHEPAGYSPITERSFESTTEDGWRNQSSHFSIIQDNSAPKSCCSVGQARYPAGYTGGTAPVSQWKPFDGRGDTEVYLSFWAKLSSNWQGHNSSVNKILFIWIHDDPSVVVSATGGGSGNLRPQLRLQNIPEIAVNLSANVNNVHVQRGQWHHWEIQLVSNTGGNRNGIARLWLDGTLVMDHRNVAYAGANQSRTWQYIYWAPTWGGVGDRVNSEMFMWMDHLYASGR